MSRCQLSVAVETGGGCEPVHRSARHLHGSWGGWELRRQAEEQHACCISHMPDVLRRPHHWACAMNHVCVCAQDRCTHTLVRTLSERHYGLQYSRLQVSLVAQILTKEQEQIVKLQMGQATNHNTRTLSHILRHNLCRVSTQLRALPLLPPSKQSAPST